MPDHELYMRRCLQLAQQAKANGESPVGSLLIKNGEIIGEGIEASKAHRDITYHAETEAIRQATIRTGSQDLSGSILYTTHEPCILCSYVIRHAKIPVVVIGLLTGSLGGYSSQMPLLTATGMGTWEAPPEVITGILSNECSALHH